MCFFFSAALNLCLLFSFSNEAFFVQVILILIFFFPSVFVLLSCFMNLLPKFEWLCWGMNRQMV